MVIMGKFLLFWFRENYGFNCYNPWILPLKDDDIFVQSATGLVDCKQKGSLGKHSGIQVLIISQKYWYCQINVKDSGYSLHFLLGK